MQKYIKKYIVVFSFLCIISIPNLFAQEQRLQNIKTGFEKIIRGIQQLGSFSDLLIRSNLKRDKQLPFSFSKKFEEQFEVETKNLLLSIKNEFGRVSVKTWNNPIVRVEVNVTAEGDSKEGVESSVDKFVLDILKDESNVHIQNKLSELEVEYLQVDYDLIVPKFSSLSIENFFGDVSVRDISGELNVLCQFGNVDVHNIEGNVSIQMQGEFSLSLGKIAGSAVVSLARTKAEIFDIRGDLNVNSSMGEIIFREIFSPKVLINIDGGGLKYFLKSQDKINLTGSVISGKFFTDFPVVKKSVGYYTKIELHNSEAERNLYFTANFSNVSILSENEVERRVNEKVPGAKPFTDVVVLEEEATPDDVLIINNQRGGIHLIGSDSNKVTIRISRLVWVTDFERAPAVMEKIVRDFHRTENRLYLTVRGAYDDSAVDVVDWRADIQVLCPSFMSVDVNSGGGETTFESLVKSLRVNQEGGNLTLRNIKGEYYVLMGGGNLYIENLDGIGDINIRKGLLNVKGINGNLVINGFQSRINLEDINSQTRIVVQDGEIKALFLNEISNNLDLKCTEGSISIILPPNPNCKITARAINGIIDSMYPLSGSFSRFKQEGEIVIGDGRVSIFLESNDGNIFIGGRLSNENPL